MGLAVGMGLGGMKEYLDRTFKDPEDLEAFSGLTVVAVIPTVETELKAKGKTAEVPLKRTRSA
jgi:capsular polysaccharide biosynthesis protein